MDLGFDVMSAMDFPSIDLPEVPVTIHGKPYVLRKANSDTGRKYRSMAARCMRMTDGQVSGIDGIGDIQPFLVSLCLFQVADDGGRVPVPIGTINCWGDDVVRSLFERAKRLSNLEEEDTVESVEKQIDRLQKRLAKLRGSSVEQQLKNSPSAATAGSA